MSVGAGARAAAVRWVAVLIDPGHRLGDSWFYVAPDGVVHAFYLRCPDDVPRHTAWDIAHATSRDLEHWTLHGLVLRRGADHEWDGRCLATGSVLATDEGYLMAYTARWDEPGVATGLATSPDLFRWTKDPAGPATRPGAGYVTDRPWSGRPPTHWRDPHLRRAPSGRLQQLITAARADAPDDASGAVAVAERGDDGTWTVGAPLPVEGATREIECPQVLEVDGRWFLVFSTWPHLCSDEVRAEHGTRLRPGTYAMAGEGPDGPFRLLRPEPIVAADHPVQPYAGQVLAIADGHVLIGTVWREDGPDQLCDPIPVIRDGDGLISVTRSA